MNKEEYDKLFIDKMAETHNKIAYIEKLNDGKKNITIFEKDKEVIKITDIDVVYFDDSMTSTLIKEVRLIRGDE